MLEILFKHMKLLCLLLILISSSVWALMPPMASDRLKARSSHIVQGEVIAVVPRGEKISNDCSDEQPFEATLKVSKTFKGKRLGLVRLRFTKTDFKNGCVGSPDRFHSVGEAGLYHLRCGIENVCALTHWNGFSKNP